MPEPPGGGEVDAEDELVRQLVGSQLYSVVFVRDYVQLYLFTKPGEPAVGNWQMIINLYVDPVVLLDDRSLRWGETGWGDALRRLIERRVTGVRIHPDDELRIMFGAAEIVTSLRPEDRDVHEAVEVMSGPHFWAY